MVLISVVVVAAVVVAVVVVVVVAVVDSIYIALFSEIIFDFFLREIGVFYKINMKCVQVMFV